MHPQILTLLKCVELEEKEQAVRYRLDQAHTLKQLKAEGLALHPLIVTRKSFGYADYPEISFRLSFPPEASQFRDGAAIECFREGEEPVKGLLLGLDGNKGEFRLYAPDFPDWIEEDGVGIKLAPDTRTTLIMKRSLEALEHHQEAYRLFCMLHDLPGEAREIPSGMPPQNGQDPLLNESQQQAVSRILEGQQVSIVHGPPGTGKTTTLVAAITELVRRGEKVLVAAPSNAAADHIARGLLQRKLPLLRVGNTGKTDADVFPFTPEGRLNNSKALKEIRQLKMRAEEFRRMALKYKRNFGKAEREQRNLLFREVKLIREEIKKLQAYNEEKLFEEAAVIAGTPIGLVDALPQDRRYDTLVIDEAGQCLEPLAWCIIPFARKLILAGDHWQLPPTVLSPEAIRLGLNRSILEAAIGQWPGVNLLNIQYRMRESIAGFSNSYFYEGRLRSAPHLSDQGEHLVFIDTAGSGYEEEQGPDGSSLQNPGELDIARQLIEQEGWAPGDVAFISPYAGQVAAARESLPEGIRISTIDSFQGQEKEHIILSLVRSNGESEVGFLKDYRRMNVAITRAREKLVVIGDSATLGADKFFRDFLTYAERSGNYRTAWEFME